MTTTTTKSKNTELYRNNKKYFFLSFPLENDWSKDESPQLRELRRRRRQRQQQRKPKRRNSTAAAKRISFVQCLR